MPTIYEYDKFHAPVLDLGLIFTESLGPRASTKVESHVSFTESKIVSQLRNVQ